MGDGGGKRSVVTSPVRIRKAGSEASLGVKHRDADPMPAVTGRVARLHGKQDPRQVVDQWKNGKETKILGADHREQKLRNCTGSWRCWPMAR